MGANEEATPDELRAGAELSAALVACGEAIADELNLDRVLVMGELGGEAMIGGMAFGGGADVETTDALRMLSMALAGIVRAEGIPVEAALEIVRATITGEAPRRPAAPPVSRLRGRRRRPV